MTQHLPCNSKEKKAVCKSRQTGNKKEMWAITNERLSISTPEPPRTPPNIAFFSNNKTKKIKLTLFLFIETHTHTHTGHPAPLVTVPKAPIESSQTVIKLSSRGIHVWVPERSLRINMLTEAG